MAAPPAVNFQPKGSLWQSISEWWWPPVKYMRATEAMQNPALKARFAHYLDHTDPPATFKASEVAQQLTRAELKAMGYFDWTDVLPAVVELAFELRELGACQVLKGGKVLGEDVLAYDIEGDVRIRRKEGE